MSILEASFVSYQEHTTYLPTVVHTDFERKVGRVFVVVVKNKSHSSGQSTTLILFHEYLNNTITLYRL